MFIFNVQSGDYRKPQKQSYEMYRESIRVADTAYAVRAFYPPHTVRDGYVHDRRICTGLKLARAVYRLVVFIP